MLPLALAFRGLARAVSGVWHDPETKALPFVAAALVLMGTIFYVPYGDSAGPRNQLVRVTGVQFAWAIDAPRHKCFSRCLRGIILESCNP